MRTSETLRSFAPLKKARACQAKEPATCRYHGSLLRMEKAIQDNNLWDYFEARAQFLQAYDENKPTPSTPKPVTAAEPDQYSASVSRGYAHFSVIEDYLHNGAEVGSAQELIYYASPQGQLELKRRLSQQYNSPYLKIQEDIDALKESGEPFPEFDLDEEHILNQLESAEQDFDAVTGNPLQAMETKTMYTPAMQHYLVEKSYEWLKQLPTDQQEAISWLTSNGFRVLQYADSLEHRNSHPARASAEAMFALRDLPVDENQIHNKYPYDFDKAETEVAKARNKEARKFHRKVKEAFKHAPKLDKPITVGRGTSVEELMSLVPDAAGKTVTQVMDELETGAHSGSPVSDSADWRRIPKSASAWLFRAAGFMCYPEDRSVEHREVMVLVKAKTIPSPVNVSAWSSTEGEVFTNPNSEYVIRSGKRVGDDLFVVELEEQ